VTTRRLRRDVYFIHMVRVNITVPDEVMVRARAAKLNISRIATAALIEELNRLVKLAELDAYLAELEAERGPITEKAAAEGRAWLDRALTAPPASDRRHGAA
jgi:post-segregation antitoxin (ccd killing protein)